VFLSRNVWLIFLLKPNLFESVTKMLVSSAKSTILVSFLFLATHLYKKEKIKDKELSLA